MTTVPHVIPKVGAAGSGGMIGFCNALFIATGAQHPGAVAAVVK